MPRTRTRYTGLSYSYTQYSYHSSKSHINVLIYLSIIYSKFIIDSFRLNNRIKIIASSTTVAVSSSSLSFRILEFFVVAIVVVPTYICFGVLFLGVLVVATAFSGACALAVVAISLLITSAFSAARSPSFFLVVAVAIVGASVPFSVPFSGD